MIGPPFFADAYARNESVIDGYTPAVPRTMVTVARIFVATGLKLKTGTKVTAIGFAPRIGKFITKPPPAVVIRMPRGGVASIDPNLVRQFSPLEQLAEVAE